jgi:hypothetical protein
MMIRKVESGLKGFFGVECEDVEITDITFPKYVSSIINYANATCKGTSPKNVGNMSELVRKHRPKSMDEWDKIYNDNFPFLIDAATRSIMDMIHKIRQAVDIIDDDMVRKWVYDLVVVKTYHGFMIQQEIIKFIGEKNGVSYQTMTSPEEESRGIDGYIDGIPVQIKPASNKKNYRGNMEGEVYYYTKQTSSYKIEKPDGSIIKMEV